MTLRRSLYLLPLLAALSACAPLPPKKPPVPQLELDLSWLGSGQGGDLSEPHPVSLMTADGDEPLVDQRLGQAFLAHLLKRGFTAGSPEQGWVLLASHSVSAHDVPVPETFRKEDYYEDGVVKEVTRYRRGVPYTDIVTTPGHWRTRKVLTQAAGVREEELVKVVIKLYAAPFHAGDLPLWEGTVQAKQATPDATAHADTIMRELAREFPTGSGAPAHRRVHL